MTVGGNTLYFAYDASGTAVVTYTYDAWGNILETLGTMAATLGKTNALTYRGYVYDNESGLYYLQSRYYNPERGRFLNVDEYPSTGQSLTGNNMFAYCGNNPVSRQDAEGDFWTVAAGAFIGGILGAVTQAVTNIVTGNDWHDGIVLAAAAGAVSGALSASSVKIVGQVVGNAIISGISEGINQINSYIENPDEFNWGRSILSVGTAAVLGGVAGLIGGDGVRAKGSAYSLALDHLDDVSARVASNVYSNSSTGAKLLARAGNAVFSTGKTATINTSIRFFAGSKVAQYGMAGFNLLWEE